MSAAIPGRIDGARVLPVLVAALALVVGAGCAAKQPARSFVEPQQRLHSGNTVYVIDDTGHETKGRVVDVSPSALTLDVDGISRRLEQDRIRQVQRYGDSLWNGVLIGMAAATPGLLIADPAYRPCTDNPSRLCADAQAGQRVLAIGLMGAIGGGIDWLIRGRRQVYLAPGQVLQSPRGVVVSPGVALTTAGLVVTLTVAR